MTAPLFGYARVSTDAQDLTAQREGLLALGVEPGRLYVDHGVTGTNRERPGLFDAIGADLLERSGFEEVMRAVDDPDPRAAVERFLYATTAMYAGNRDVLQALFAMAQIDPTALGGTITRMEDGRARGMQLLATRLADEGLLRDGAKVDGTADLLWLLSSFDSCDQLYTGRGRNPDQIADTYLATLRGSVLV